MKATLFILVNSNNSKFISNDKIALWAQTDKLADAHFFPAAHNAAVNAKRLNNACEKARKQLAAGTLESWTSVASHVNDYFVVMPVQVSLNE